MADKRAVGVFDSGVGGLTVLRALQQRLPAEQLLYLGDTARVPYGTKSAPRVVRYALEAAQFLVEKGVKLLVVACNTASAVALPALQRCLQVPVVGVIEPGAAAAIDATHNHRIGVIGTEGTMQSGAYQTALQRLSPQSHVVGAACPLFVPLAEEGWHEHDVARLAAREYLQPLLAANIDTLVLGCTHYPLLKGTLTQLLANPVRLVDSAEATAQAVAEILWAHNYQCEPAVSKPEGPRFYVTDVPDRFARVGSIFLGYELPQVVQVTLPEAAPLEAQLQRLRLASEF